jgi:hypothetical protein
MPFSPFLLCCIIVFIEISMNTLICLQGVPTCPSTATIFWLEKKEQLNMEIFSSLSIPCSVSLKMCSQKDIIYHHCLVLHSHLHRHVSYKGNSKCTTQKNTLNTDKMFQTHYTLQQGAESCTYKTVFKYLQL